MSKSHKVYQLQMEKIIVSIDIYFIEDQHCDSEKPRKYPTVDTLLDLKDLVYDSPFRDTRLISDIYQRCKTTICEPTIYDKA